MRRIGFSLAVVLLLAPSACHDDDDLAPVKEWSVVYSAEVSGSGALTEVAYDDGSGTPVVVAAPQAPWSRTLSMQSGQTVSLRVRGTLDSGAIRAVLDARCPTGCPLHQEKSCSGTSLTCDLEIEPTRLP